MTTGSDFRPPQNADTLPQLPRLDEGPTVDGGSKTMISEHKSGPRRWTVAIFDALVTIHGGELVDWP